MKKFLEEKQDEQATLIDTRRWAMDKADTWFKEEYEDRMTFNELYEAERPEFPNEYTLRDPYKDIFFDKMDEFEEGLLDYRNKIYEELNID